MNSDTVIIHNDPMPPCCRADCFACENGLCEILTSNDFGARDCPFFKPRPTDGSDSV